LFINKRKERVLTRTEKNAVKMKNSKSNYTPTRAFGKDVLKYVPAQVIPSIIGFFAIAIYTRLLNPEQYGQYILVIVTISLISSSLFSWLNQAGVRYFEEYKKKGRFVQFTSTTLISLFASVAVIFIIWYGVTSVLNKAWPSDLIRLIQIGGVVLATQTIYLFILVLLRADRKIFRYALYVLLNSLGTFLVAICLIKFAGLGPEGILLAMIAFSGGISFFELIQFVRNHLIKISNFYIELLKRFASYGVPMIGVSMGALVVSVSDRYMIQYFMGTKVVGIYSATYIIAEKGIQGISSILMLAAFPVIFQTFAQRGEKETSTLLGRLIGIYFIALVPAIFGITILSKDIVGVILGKSFREAYIILPWVAGGVFFHGLGLYFGSSFELKERTKSLFWIYAIAASINIVLNIFWIPKFGILGAAYATLIAYFVYLIMTWMFGVKLLTFVFPLD
jgi:O-antigen/teichoic acid export membrane protein